MFEQSKGYDVWAHFMIGPEPYQASKQTIQNQSLLKKKWNNSSKLINGPHTTAILWTLVRTYISSFTNTFKKYKSDQSLTPQGMFLGPYRLAQLLQ